MKTLSPLLAFGILVSVSAYPIPAQAGDIEFYGILKQKEFAQTSGTAPALLPSGAFSFQAFVDASEPDVITDAFLQLPSGGARVLAPDGSSGFSFGEEFDSEGALNAAYGTGNYTLQIFSENDDFSFAQLAMPVNNFPGAPFVTNYVAAQSINPSNDFTLHWSGFTGGTASDFIQLDIEDSEGNPVFQTGDTPGSGGSLDGTSTEIVIPANTLSPGEQYDVVLFFARPVVSDGTSIPGAQGVVAFGTRSRFKVMTTGLPQLLVLRALGFSGGGFQFDMATKPGRGYQIEFSDSLAGWTNLYFTNATAEHTLVTDPFPPSGQSRFYRAYRTGNGGNQ